MWPFFFALTMCCPVDGSAGCSNGHDLVMFVPTLWAFTGDWVMEPNALPPPVSIDEKLVASIEHQVRSARAMTLALLTAGIGMVAMISSATYADFVAGKVQSLPGLPDVRLPLGLVLPLAPALLSLMHVATLYHYKGLADACRRVWERTGRIRKGMDLLCEYKAQLPNDPFVLWQMALGGGAVTWSTIGYGAAAVTLLVVIPFTIVMLLSLLSMSFQVKSIYVVNFVSVMVSAVLSYFWYRRVSHANAARTPPKGAGVVARWLRNTLQFVLFAFFALLLLVFPLMSWILVYQHSSVSDGHLDAHYRVPAIVDESDPPVSTWSRILRFARLTYRVRELPYEKSWLCQNFTGLGCFAPDMAHMALYKPAGDGSGPDTRPRLNGRSLRFADMRDAGLVGADLSQADLTGARLHDADLSKATLVRTNLYGAGLNGTRLSGAYLEGLDLRGADWRGVNLAKATLRDVNLAQSDLRWVDFTGANFTYTPVVEHTYRTDGRVGCPQDGRPEQAKCLYGSDLRLADLREARMVGVGLEKAHLEGAKLMGTDLRGARLRGALLEQADLRDARLIGADLREADLTGADLNRTDLRGADLRGARLDVDRIKGAKLHGALLCTGTTDSRNTCTGESAGAGCIDTAQTVRDFCAGHPNNDAAAAEFLQRPLRCVLPQVSNNGVYNNRTEKWLPFATKEKYPGWFGTMPGALSAIQRNFADSVVKCLELGGELDAGLFESSNAASALVDIGSS